MTSINRNARVAGFFYLLVVLVAPLRLIYIPGALFVSGDAAATAAHIAAHETLFRLGIVTDVCCGVFGIFLALALYRLFKAVDAKYAVLMVALGVMPDAIYLFNVLNDFAALILVRGADFLSAFSAPQRAALAMLFLKLHSQEVVAAEIFWGLWLFPLAMLAYRSRYVPRLLGIWLVVNGLAYLALSFTGLLWPQYLDRIATIAFPAQLGEVAFMVWLLLVGAKEPGGDALVPRPAGQAGASLPG